jgi:hypothetical protein
MQESWRVAEAASATLEAERRRQEEILKILPF